MSPAPAEPLPATLPDRRNIGAMAQGNGGHGMTDFATMTLPGRRDVVAPDGSDVRVPRVRANRAP